MALSLNFLNSPNFGWDVIKLQNDIKQLQKFGFSLTKENIENKYIVLLSTHLMSTERNLIRKDLDELIQTTTMLSRSVQYHENRNSSNSREIELLIKEAVIAQFKADGWEASEIPLKDGIILDRKLSPLVQWDIIVAAEKEDEKILYIVEVKITGHTNDIDSLVKRYKSTQSYFHELRKDDYFKQKMKLEFKMQSLFLKSFIDYKLFPIYASDHLNSDVKDKIEEIGNQIQSVGYISMKPEIDFKKFKYIK